jgi:hypothetical protein
MAKRKATTRATRPPTRRRAPRTAAQRATRSTNELLGRYTDLLKSAVDGNLKLATRVQRLWAESASAATKSPPNELSISWPRVIDAGLSMYESYVSQSLTYWDGVLSAAEKSLGARRK